MRKKYNEWLKENKGMSDDEIKNYDELSNKFRRLRWEFFKKDVYFDMYSLPLVFFVIFISPLISLFLIGIMLLYLIEELGTITFTEIYFSHPLMLLWGGYAIMIIPVAVTFFINAIVQSYAKGYSKEPELKKELEKKEK